MRSCLMEAPTAPSHTHMTPYDLLGRWGSVLFTEVRKGSPLGHGSMGPELEPSQQSTLGSPQGQGPPWGQSPLAQQHLEGLRPTAHSSG